MMKKSKKGFTLIELLVVVAIIGVLAAIAIPQFANYRKSAANSAALSDAKTIATEAEAFYAENGVYPN
ncbi:MAG: prepilin-type N-terminal cleavage/methylation domain-containing protein [Campylobacterales bacterium]|nr:prepilin-type N-terminal cleavage/methylation domain-containing protein [Campylobacterales bacterium]